METKRCMRVWVVAVAIGAMFVLATSTAHAHDYHITSWAELQDMQSDLTGDYYLDTNLDQSTSGYETYGANFTSVGGSPVEGGTPFTGSLNGNGHQISGLHISQPNDMAVGLFAAADLGSNKIQNLKLTVNDISGWSGGAERNYQGVAGALVGLLVSGTVTRVEVEVAGTISGSWSSGGLVGSSMGGSIQDSYVKIDTGSVITNPQRAAGMVGNSMGLSILNSYVELDGTISSGTFAGGLVPDFGVGLIANSFVTGTGVLTSANGDWPGGGIGAITDGATITNVAWYTGLKNAEGGDLPAITLKNWSYRVGLLAADGLGTDVGSASYFYSLSNAPLSSWDFTNTWFARPDNTPVLRWMMQDWLSSGGTSLGITLSAEDVTTLMNVFASQGTTMLDGYTWTYMPGILPGDTDGTLYDFGDTWTYDGHKYLKLGSGFELDPLGGGSVPEPSSMAVSGIALGLFGLIKRMRRKPETRD